MICGVQRTLIRRANDSQIPVSRSNFFFIRPAPNTRIATRREKYLVFVVGGERACVGRHALQWQLVRPKLGRHTVSRRARHIAMAVSEKGASRRNEGTGRNNRELAPTVASRRVVHETKMATDV